MSTDSWICADASGDDAEIFKNMGAPCTGIPRPCRASTPVDFHSPEEGGRTPGGNLVGSPRPQTSMAMSFGSVFKPQKRAGRSMTSPWWFPVTGCGGGWWAQTPGAGKQAGAHLPREQGKGLLLLSPHRHPVVDQLQSATGEEQEESAFPLHSHRLFSIKKHADLSFFFCFRKCKQLSFLCCFCQMS